MSTPVRITADYAYFRLRDEGYTAGDIARWADTIAAETSACRDVFVYFKHEEEGKGPEFARLLIDALAGSVARPSPDRRGVAGGGPAFDEPGDPILGPVAVVLPGGGPDETAVSAVRAGEQR